MLSNFLVAAFLIPYHMFTLSGVYNKDFNAIQAKYSILDLPSLLLFHTTLVVARLPRRYLSFFSGTRQWL